MEEDWEIILDKDQLVDFFKTADKAFNRNASIIGLVNAMDACMAYDEIIEEMPKDFFKNCIGYLNDLSSENALNLESLACQLEIIVSK